MHVAGDSVLLHGGSSCAVDAGQYLSPEASYIGMELRGNRDVMMFIRISELGDSVVPRFGVYGVFVVGKQALGCAWLAAWLWSRWRPSLDTCGALMVETRFHGAHRPPRSRPMPD